MEEPDDPSSLPQTPVDADMSPTELLRLVNLNKLALALVAASHPEQVGSAFMRDGLALCGASAGSLMTLDSERFQMFAHRGIVGESAVRWNTFPLDVGNEPFSDVIIEREPLFFENSHELLDAYPLLADELEANPTHQAWAALPLHIGDHVVGVIGLIYDAPRHFDTQSRLVLDTLAKLIAQATSRARLLEEQRIALTSVETALAPRIDPMPDVEVSHLYRSATVASGAGGDWYDIVRLNDSSTLIAIGDVANHGAVAVGEMARVRSAVHTLAFADLTPGAITHGADRVLSAMASTHTTSLVAVLDHDSATLTWTNAGHPYPVLVPVSGPSRFLDTTHGVPLGVGVTAHYGEEHDQLVDGDTIVFYTDGLIEQSGEPIDTAMERLRSTVTNLVNTHESRNDLATKLFLELRPSGHHEDDIAIVTLRYQPGR